MSAGKRNGAALLRALKANGYKPPRDGEPLVDPERYPLLFALRPRTISMLRRTLAKPTQVKRPIDPQTGEPFTSDEIIRRVGSVYPSIVLSVTALATDEAEPHAKVPAVTRNFIEEKLSAILERLERAERDPDAPGLRDKNSPITRELSAAAFGVRELLQWNQRTKKEPLADYSRAAAYAADFKDSLGLPLVDGIRVCWHALVATRGEDISVAEAKTKNEWLAMAKACKDILRGKTG